jgi:hypothetical protein
MIPVAEILTVQRAMAAVRARVSELEKALRQRPARAKAKRRDHVRGD